MSQPNLNEDLNIVANSNLTIAYLDGNLDIIQQLDDEPNDVGGLTSAELKAKFDEAGNTIKTYINGTLIPAILAEDATEEARASAEAARETAEQARASAEGERAAAEAARAEAEAGRVSAEAARVTAEQERAAAEQARADENTGIVAQATAQAEAAAASASAASTEADLARSSANSAAASAEAAETAKVAAEAAKDSAESAAKSALSYKTVAYSSAVLAGQERGAAEQAKVNAEAAQGKAEDAKTAAETAQEAAESARDTAVNAKDSAKDSAALSMGYAIGTVSNPFEFSVPANSSEDFVVLADPDSPAIVEDGKKYRITVNREIAYAEASGRSISALGVTISSSGSSYHVENQNDYDVTGLFGAAATQTIGKSAAEYADEASRAAEQASSAETTATEQAEMAKASETAAKASETEAAASAEAAAASAEAAAAAAEAAGSTGASALISKHNSDASAHADIRQSVSSHAGDTAKHITDAERASWNAKLSSFTETDPTVPSWAKAASKPSYTAAEVGARPNTWMPGKGDIGLGNVDNVKQYSASNPPPYPVTSVNGLTGAVTIKPKTVSAVLTASGWDSTAKTQTVTVTGVSATEKDQLITPVPALASQAAYYDAGIRCTGQAANSLTFTADTVPTANLTVYVTIQEVSA